MLILTSELHKLSIFESENTTNYMNGIWHDQQTLKKVYATTEKLKYLAEYKSCNYENNIFEILVEICIEYNNFNKNLFFARFREWSWTNPFGKFQIWPKFTCQMFYMNFEQFEKIFR